VFELGGGDFLPELDQAPNFRIQGEASNYRSGNLSLGLLCIFSLVWAEGRSDGEGPWESSKEFKWLS
jgi:hypothetical protein